MALLWFLLILVAPFVIGIIVATIMKTNGMKDYALTTLAVVLIITFGVLWIDFAYKMSMLIVGL